MISLCQENLHKETLNYFTVLSIKKSSCIDHYLIGWSGHITHEADLRCQTKLLVNHYSSHLTRVG